MYCSCPDVGGLRDVAVLGVVEALEDRVDLLLLVGDPDEVDVGVLAVHEVEIGAVAAHGEAAGETQLDSLGAGRIDGVHGLGHEPVGAARRLLRLRGLGLDHRAGLRRAGALAQVLERVQHGVQDVPRQVHARPVLLGPLDEQAARLELAHRASRRRVGHLEDALRLRHGHRRRAEELVGQTQRVTLDLLAIALVVADERARLAGRALGRLLHAEGEEREPRRPLVVRAHTLQQRVVLVAVALQERREIQQRPREALALDEEQRDEQPPQAAVAADERVDALELRVEHGALDEIGQAAAFLQELLERGQHLGQLLDRRRHVGRGRHGRAGRAEPVLRGSELARRARPADLAAQQALVERLDELERERLLAQQLDAEAQGRDAGAHLAQVVAWHALACGADLVEVEVGETHVRALDARRAERLLAFERGVEQLRIGQLAADAGELSERGVGARQRQDQLLRVTDPRGERRRDKGGVPLGGTHDLAGTRSVKLTWVHDACLASLSFLATAALKAYRTIITNRRRTCKDRPRLGGPQPLASSPSTWRATLPARSFTISRRSSSSLRNSSSAARS